VRLPVELAVGEGEARRLWVTSLSTSGVFVIGDLASPGAHVSLSFALPGTRFGLQGAVVRTQTQVGTGNHAGFGVVFTHSPPSWRAVAHFLMSQSAQPDEVQRQLQTRDRVLLVSAIAKGSITRQAAAARHGISLVQLFEWERKIRRANENPYRPPN
jgi:hypothetical protein